MTASHIQEPSRNLSVIDEVDLCVVGGSCTGVFAAVRAARLGLKVALIETLNQFGGTATGRMVYVWHSLWDFQHQNQIIGGLTREIMDRLVQRDAVFKNDGSDPAWQFRFNPAELAIELDQLITEHPTIQPYLHTRMADAVCDNQGEISHVILEDKSGRRAIRCHQVIDASGDADVLRRLGIQVRRPEVCQPPTLPALLWGLEKLKSTHPDFNLRKTIFNPDNPKALPPGYVWGGEYPAGENLTAFYGTRVHGVDCSKAEDLTRAEMEGRDQLRRIIDLIREEIGDPRAVDLVSIPAAIGIRETVHAHCGHQLTETEVLNGQDFEDRIAVGTYRVDIHKQGGEGVVFRNLDGTEQTSYADGRREFGRWRPEQDEDPPYFQIPYRSLLPMNAPQNLLLAGRHIDADPGAFGAIRVMVNCNQMGEAAGVAAALCKKNSILFPEVDHATLQTELRNGGSLLP